MRDKVESKAARSLFIMEAYNKGYDQGKADWRPPVTSRESYKEGYAQCKLDNKQRHIDEGYEQGYADGRASYRDNVE